MNIAELVKEAKNNSKAAQKCLFDQLSGVMLMLCRRYMRNNEDAEEVLLDGFYQCFTHLKNFDYKNEPAFRAWLKKIIVSQCLMALRKKNSFVMLTEAAAEDIPVTENILHKLSAAEIFKLVVQLPVGYRTVFNLHAIEGYEHHEIADLLGIAEGTSKSQLSKAKALLQKLLAQNNYYAEQGVAK